VNELELNLKSSCCAWLMLLREIPCVSWIVVVTKGPRDPRTTNDTKEHELRLFATTVDSGGSSRAPG
jgi:hypothetical protein